MVASVVFGLLSTALDRSVTASEDSTVRTGAEPASAASSTVEPAVEELSTPEPSASARIGVRLDGELFAGWRWSEPRGVGDATNAFEIDRAELGVRFELPRNFGLEVRVESGRPPELSGDVLGGSPLYLRLRRAAGSWRYRSDVHELDVRFGLIDDIWTNEIGRRYALRALAPSIGEIADFYTTADLGLSARGSLFDERLTLSIAATNGEGRIDREANPAKNLTVVATGTPLQLDVHRGPLSIRLHAAFRRGTLGEDNVPNHRYSAAVSFVGPCPSAGFEVHLADGRDGNDEKSLGYGVWANSWLATHWIGVAARYDSLDDGTEGFEHDGLAQRATVAVFSDLFDERGATDRRRMRLYLAYQRDWYGEDADALRGASQARDVDRVMFTLEARGSWSN